MTGIFPSRVIVENRPYGPAINYGEVGRKKWFSFFKFLKFRKGGPHN